MNEVGTMYLINKKNKIKIKKKGTPVRIIYTIHLLESRTFSLIKKNGRIQAMAFNFYINVWP